MKLSPDISEGSRKRRVRYGTPLKPIIRFAPRYIIYIKSSTVKGPQLRAVKRLAVSLKYLTFQCQRKVFKTYKKAICL